MTVFLLMFESLFVTGIDRMSLKISQIVSHYCIRESPNRVNVFSEPIPFSVFYIFCAMCLIVPTLLMAIIVQEVEARGGASKRPPRCLITVSWAAKQVSGHSSVGMNT